jgi:hypothetical protein
MKCNVQDVNSLATVKTRNFGKNLGESSYFAGGATSVISLK